MSKVAVVMGSKTDLKVMQDAVDLLKTAGVNVSVHILSAHRTPALMAEFATSAYDRGFSVIIAGAGGAAHLPGMLASYTTLPVIGVPVSVGVLLGLDALLSVAQMPKGVPVATMAINGAANAALFAIQILAVGGDRRAEKFMNDHKRSQRLAVKKMQSEIKTKGRVSRLLRS